MRMTSMFPRAMPGTWSTQEPTARPFNDAIAKGLRAQKAKKAARLAAPKHVFKLVWVTMRGLGVRMW